MESLPNLDAADRRIIEVLRNDARITVSELAARINMSVSACSVRVRKLQAQRVITGYRAQIDEKILGLAVTAVVDVALVDQSKTTFRAFEKLIERRGEVRTCYSVGGDMDYVLIVKTRTIEEFQSFIDACLNNDGAVARFNSRIVYARTK